MPHSSKLSHPMPDRRKLSRAAALGFTLAGATIVLDRGSKTWALDALFDPPVRLTVAPVLDLVPVWNRGVSFGLLSNDAAWGPWLLGGFALAVAGALVIWLRSEEGRVGKGWCRTGKSWWGADA